MSAWLVYVAIGIASGVAAGLFGVGGGLIVVPALIYWAGFSQHMATGTSLAVLLPPIGLAAAFEYYRNGNVDVPAAILIAITMFLGAWIGARLASHVSGPHLRLMFGLFVCCLGVYLVYGAYERLG
ncbi:sulfite exporter TauE/SafE family protein [Pseudomonas sp. QL9]|uniref:sulfite exporter TauE/SafE family protein n=1 Tax=Pseudomonas TaxID=286 RepID=UPI001362699F|nr:sulfite exporter TauE/SafE family protein [Pseudomonas knackmussii]